MEIGTRLVLRGGSPARQSSSGIVCPLNSGFCLFGASLFPLLSVFLSSSTFLSFALSPLPRTWLRVSSPRSVSRYFSPYSVRLGTVAAAAADSPSFCFRSPPPHMTSLCWGAPGSHFFTDDPISLWKKEKKKTERTDPYLYYSSYRDWREGLWVKKNDTCLTGDLRMMKGLLNTHST